MRDVANLLLVSLVGAILSFSLYGDANAQTRGGDATIALYANTSSLDPHFQTSHIGGSILFGMYEGLVTVDEDGNVIPMLADSWSSSSDGLSYVFKLRENVSFHNGKAMTSRDVQASLQRYLRISPDQTMKKLVKGIVIKSSTEVEIVLHQPNSTFLSRLASPSSPASIIPAEQSSKPLNHTANIGTGPFQFDAWVPGNYVRLKRFDTYSANTSFDGPTGFGGRKTVYFDSVTYRFMPETSARVAALEAGEIELAEEVPALAAARLSDNPRIRIERVDQFNMPTLFLNHSGKPTNDLWFRRAIQTALDMNEIMAGATDGTYSLDNSWLWPVDRNYTNVGAEYYNAHDIDLAKTLLAKSDYRGENVDLLMSNISFHKKIGTILIEQLRAIGLNVRPMTVDLATLSSVIQTDDGWNLAVNGFRAAPFLGAYAYEPIFSGDGNWARIKPEDNEQMQAQWARFSTASDIEIGKQAWANIQALTHSNVTMLKLGNQVLLVAVSERLKGYRPFAGGERMWNVWFDNATAVRLDLKSRRIKS